MIRFYLAHQFLYRQGILHRDISAGNILLALDPETALPGCEGFLADLEFARIHEDQPSEAETSLINAMQKLSTTPTSESMAKRGAVMTVRNTSTNTMKTTPS